MCRVVFNLIVDFISEHVLMSKKVLNLRLFDRHSLLISPVHSILVVLKSVLDSKVLLLGNLGQLLLHLVRASLIDQVVGKLLLVVHRSRSVFNQMQEDLSLIFGQLSDDLHKLREVLLVVFVLLPLGLGVQVGELDELFEFGRLSVHF